MPMWSVIRMVSPKAPIPAYIAEQFTWPLPYRSFYDPYIIMTGFMGIMGVVWSGFTYIFLKAIFYAIGKTTKHFVEPAGEGPHRPFRWPGASRAGGGDLGGIPPSGRVGGRAPPASRPPPSERGPTAR